MNNLYHRNIIFSDESWFFMGSNNYYVWREIGKAYDTVTKDNDIHIPKVMFWGGIAYNFKTPLVFFTSNVTSPTYVNVAIKGCHLKALADLRFGVNSWLLQQDNAKAHTAINTQNEFLNIGISVLPYWPPYSPDLSPIEMIWAIMKRRVDKYRPQNTQQLIAHVQYVWNNISYSTINRLIDSFPIRLRKCIETGGEEVRFHL